MNSAKEVAEFPYNSSLICYFEVDKRGNTAKIYHKNKSDRPCLLDAYKRAIAEEIVIYAVWPGRWSSDLFMIDNLDIFAKKFGLLEE
ncbi:MAG: hypothetical protein AB9883_00885 [Acidaminococcaceae bacterium]